MSVTKHARRRLDKYGRARSRPNYTDDFPYESEMRPQTEGGIISERKILPPHFPSAPLGVIQIPGGIVWLMDLTKSSYFS